MIMRTVIFYSLPLPEDEEGAIGKGNRLLKAIS
jgi:hypothetical protein